MTSITSAIKQAREEVRMYKFGDGHIVETYSHQHKAWWQGQPQPYAKALNEKSNEIVVKALVALGVAPEDAQMEPYTYSQGWGGLTIRERVKKALKDSQVAA